MTEPHRSGCPINLTLELLGDRWSLIVIRDILFGNRRHFRELLTQSEEGIASNILADRLKRLLEAGLLGETAAGESTAFDAPKEFKSEQFVEVLEVHTLGVPWYVISFDKTKIRRRCNLLQYIFTCNYS